MNKKIRTEAVDSLFEAILTLESKEECYSFFEDLCTVNELLSLSQRFEVATMLRKHDTYLKIAEKTGASTATISRVNRSLNYGDDGYALFCKNAQHEGLYRGREGIRGSRRVRGHYFDYETFEYISVYIAVRGRSAAVYGSGPSIFDISRRNLLLLR